MFVPLAMQLRNTVCHKFQSVVHVSFSSMINGLDLHLKTAEIRKVLKCSALSVNVVYRCVMQVW